MKRLLLATGLLTILSTSAFAEVAPAKVESANRVMAKQSLMDRASKISTRTPAGASGLEAVVRRKVKTKADGLSLERQKELAIEAVRKEIGPSAMGPDATVDVFVGAIDNAESPGLHQFSKSGVITIYTKRRVDPNANLLQRIIAKFSGANKVSAVEIDPKTGNALVLDQQRRAPQYKMLSFLKLHVPLLQLAHDLKNNDAELSQFKTSATALAGTFTAGALHLNPMVVGGALATFGGLAYRAVQQARAEENNVRDAAFNVAFTQAKDLQQSGKAVGITDVKMLYDGQLQGTGTLSEPFGAFYKRLRLREVADAASTLASQ